MDNKRPLIAHLCLFCSGAFWGLMAPVGKDAMMHGIDGIDLVSFRVLGGAILFGLPPFHQERESACQRHLLVWRSGHLRPCFQPVFLHHRPQHDFA